MEEEHGEMPTEPASRKCTAVASVKGALGNWAQRTSIREFEGIDRKASDLMELTEKSADLKSLDRTDQRLSLESASPKLRDRTPSLDQIDQCLLLPENSKI